jgi:Sulfotransferase family
MELFTVIGRGHSGTRAMSHTLSASGVYMGAPQNDAGDLLPPEDIYEACRVFAKYVTWEGDLKWDFSKVLAMKPDPAFTRLIESFLSDVLESDAEKKGWKIPETTLVWPWILKTFPEIKPIFWVRNPRDCILKGHLTDDLHDFGIEYPQTDDLRERRALSWRYQYELVKASPKPSESVSLRLEDFVLNQDETLAKLGALVGLEMARIPVKPEAVGRFSEDDGVNYFDFLGSAMREYGYELPASA